jgi:hypothetical protein
MNKPFLFLCSALAALSFSSCQQKQYKAYFLTESSNVESGGAFNVRYNGRMYNRMPIMSLKHFEKFKSFMADDGSYGAVLYTSKNYRMRLFSETHQNIGKLMLPVIDGLAYPPIEIDRGITDGQVIIWGGLTGYDLRKLGETLDPVDPEMEEKRYLDKNPRPKPEIPKDAKPSKDMHGRLIPELYASAIPEQGNSYSGATGATQPAAAEKATPQEPGLINTRKRKQQ